MFSKFAYSIFEQSIKDYHVQDNVDQPGVYLAGSASTSCEGERFARGGRQRGDVAHSFDITKAADVAETATQLGCPE